MIQIIVFIPVSHKEAVKQSMFKAGAGMLGNYDSCCFQTEGEGQFRPLEGSNPFIGKKFLSESVKEVKIELAVEDHLIQDVILALKSSHPYETPAYFVFKAMDI